MKRLSLTTWSLIALAAGLGLGIIGHKTGGPSFQRFGDWTKSAGALWVAALQLAVMPLVITNVLAAITGAGAKSVGKLGLRAFLLFAALLIGAGLFAIVLTPPLVARLPLDPGTVISLGAAAAGSNLSGAATSSVSVTDWIGSLLPNNLFEAGLKGEIFPLLLFAAFFGLAVTRLSGERQRLLTDIFQGLADAMLHLTNWILVATPVGVFALTYVLALRIGISGGGILGAYIAIVSALMILFTILLYPLSAFLGKTTIGTFARAVGPAQVVAATTRSSLAALPALVEGARERLHLPPSGTSFVLPLSVAVFKVNRPISSIVKLMLVAHVYGITLQPSTILVFLATVIVISSSAAGIPQSGPGLKTIPAYIAAGVPIEGVLVVEAVEAIPDIFKTLLNVTGDMSVATLLTHSEGLKESQLEAVETSTVVEGAV